MARIGRAAPPLAVMALIFFLSAQPGLDSGLGAWDLVLRKLAHITIFALLWFALARSFRWRRPVLATAIALAYAASDEWHQTFVPDRGGTPVDVAIDGLGIGLAVLVWWLATRRAQRRRRPPGRLAPTASRAR